MRWRGLWLVGALTLVGQTLACQREPADPAALVRLYEAGEYEAAIAIGEALLRQDIDRATTLNNLGLLYQTVGRYDEALAVLEEAVALTEAEWGSDHPETAMSLTNLAGLYRQLGRYTDAELLFERAITIYAATTDWERERATSLNNLGALYESMGDYDAAEDQYSQALRIRQALGESPQTGFNNLGLLYLRQGRYAEAEPYLQQARSLTEANSLERATNSANLAALYRALGRYTEAEPLYQEALNLSETILGPDHPEVATDLNNLAVLYRVTGRYFEAETLLQRSLAIRRANFGDDHPELLTSLNNLATLYRAVARYREAEALYDEALAIASNHLDNLHPYRSTLLNNQAALATDLGQLEQAAELYQASLSISEASLGSSHPETITTRHNLAGIRLEQGDLEAAIRELTLTLEARQRLLGADHPDVATSLTSLGAAYREAGRYADALAQFERADALVQTQLDRRHPLRIMTLNNRADSHLRLGDTARAELLLQEALALAIAILPTHHPDQALVHHNLANLSRQRADFTTSLSHLSQALEIEEQVLLRTLTSQSEREQRDYLATLDGGLDLAVSLHLQQLAADPAAATLALTTLLRRKGRILDTLSQQRSRLTTRDQERLDLLQQIYRDLATTDDPAAATALRADSEALEQALGDRNPNLSFEPVTIAALQALIPTDAALVEYVRYQAPEPRYAAYILTANGPPRGIDLGDAEAIDTALDSLMAAFEDRTVPLVELQRRSQAVYDLVLAPLNIAPTVQHLLLAPDDRLNLLSFAALDTGSGLVIDRYRLTYLTSGRDLRHLNRAAAVSAPDAIFANPTYHTFAPLPGTLAEAERIQPLLNVPKVFTEAAASREALFGLANPRILHLATHGLFEPSATPMLSAGLALASTNQQETLVSALEMTTLNLGSSELVVLSACDTGLGDSVAGEGIYGLRRALHLAGAASSVVSLWSVDDWATTELMAQFYQALLAEGRGRSEALQQAQQMLASDPETAHPYYWAAFIPLGDWRPLSRSERTGVDAD